MLRGLKIVAKHPHELWAQTAREMSKAWSEGRVSGGQQKLASERRSLYDFGREWKLDKAVCERGRSFMEIGYAFISGALFPVAGDGFNAVYAHLQSCSAFDLRFQTHCQNREVFASISKEPEYCRAMGESGRFDEIVKEYH